MNGEPVRGLRVAAGADIAVIRSSTRAAGDFSIEGPAAALAHRRAAFQPGCWTQLDEVHGTAVLVVDRPGAHDGAVGDGLVTGQRGAVLATWVGDCAPVAFAAADGVIAACHAGWRGALDGVLARTVTVMREAGAQGPIIAYLGPCIHGCCYEFGDDLLAIFTERFGCQVGAVTSSGRPSLHMPAVVDAALSGLVAVVDQRLTECTACHPDRRYSHRRGDAGRQVLTITRMAAA